MTNEKILIWTNQIYICLWLNSFKALSKALVVNVGIHCDPSETTFMLYVHIFIYQVSPEFWLGLHRHLGCEWPRATSKPLLVLMY